jgi:hypothetical protein
MDGSRKDKMMCKMPQEVSSQKLKGQVQMQTEYDIGALISKIRCEANNRIVYGSLFLGKAQTPADKWILHNNNAPSHDALRDGEFLNNKSITKMDHPPHSPPFSFLLFPKLKKKCPEG